MRERERERLKQKKKHKERERERETAQWLPSMEERRRESCLSSSFCCRCSLGFTDTERSWLAVDEGEEEVVEEDEKEKEDEEEEVGEGG